MAEAHLSGGGGAFVLSEKFKEYYAFRKEWLRRIATSVKRVVLMPIRGTSMQPTIMDGDVVMLDTGRTRIFDGQIYALSQADTIMIKRLENLVGGRVRIISENRTEFPPYEAEARDIRIIGQIIWFARELVPRE
jgi:phage repressor protein C with HTH and peptisase S24 domain